MKSENENELVRFLMSDKIRPYVQGISAVVLLAAALWIALTGMRGNKQRQLQEGWQAYMTAAAEQDMESLRGLGGRFPKTEAAAWGMQSAGDIALATGSRNMYFDRAAAIELLKRAREDYESAGNMATTELLKQRSLLGLAQAQEALNEFDDAVATYEKVVTRWPDSSLAQTSKERIAFLNHPDTTAFYNWFMEQQPVVPQPNPLGGSSIRPPSPYADLPADPELQLPDVSVLDETRAGVPQAPEAGGSAEANSPAAEISEDAAVLDASEDRPPSTDSNTDGSE